MAGIDLKVLQCSYEGSLWPSEGGTAGGAVTKPPLLGTSPGVLLGCHPWGLRAGLMMPLEFTQYHSSGLYPSQKRYWESSRERTTYAGVPSISSGGRGAGLVSTEQWGAWAGLSNEA